MNVAEVLEKALPTMVKKGVTVVNTPVRNGTPRHSMLGRMTAGSASTTNGIRPSAR